MPRPGHHRPLDLAQEIDMTIRNKVLACVAAFALLASGSAFAALDAGEIHLALDSLRVALAKMAVANAILSKPKPPSNNAEARLGAPDRMTSNEIRSILVSNGGVINVYLTPAVGVTDGIIQLVPKVVTGKEGRKRVSYSCSSPNIPDIATAAPECRYAPAG
jgi:hypothetical protein